MAQPAKLSALEQSMGDYIAQSRSYEDLVKSFTQAARAGNAEPAHMIAAADMLVSELATRTNDLGQLASEDGQIKFYDLAKGLRILATKPDVVKMMPQGFALHVADGMAACLANEALPDYEASMIYQDAKSIISIETETDTTKAKRTAVSICKLAAACAGRPDLYVDAARFAVSEKLNLTNSAEMAEIVNSFAMRADPVLVMDVSDEHVHALQMFANNKKQWCDFTQATTPALYQALANFDEVIARADKTTTDEKTAQKRQGLLQGREAISTLISHGQYKLFN